MRVTAKQIRQSLISQLTAKGGNVNHFADLIEDYIFFWSCEKKMKADIKKNGIKYSRSSAKGTDIEVENPAVKSAVMYNKQMLQILDKLALTTSGVTLIKSDTSSEEKPKKVEEDEDCGL